MKNLRKIVVLVVALTLSLVASGQVVSADSTVDGAMSESARKNPKPLIRRMARAVGGPSMLGQVETMAVDANGVRAILDEDFEVGSGSGGSSDYDLKLAFEVESERLRLDYDINSPRFGPRQISEIIVGDSGYTVGQDSNVAPPGAAAMQTDRLVSTLVHQSLMNPQLLVAALLDGELAARLVGPVNLRGAAHDVLVVPREGGSPLRIFVKQQTNLITRVDVLENDPLRRDTQVIVRYNNWRWADGDVRVPMRVKVFYDGELVQDETRHSVAVNAPLPADLFTPPDVPAASFDPVLAHRGMNSHQHLQSFAALGFPLDGLQLDVVATELTPGVHWLAGGTHHSLLVEHDDGLVLVDAPLNEYRANALLEYIAASFPGQPITHMAQSHHHADHSAGVRTVVATGADLVVHRSAQSFWSRVLRAPSTVSPDGLALDPTDFDIITVADGSSTSVGSGANAVQLHSFEQNHSEDLVLVVAGGVAFIVDYFNPFPGAPLAPEGQVIIDLIAERGLDVEIIAGGHGAFINMG